ncbi:hypothetical protein [Streptomyces sp. DH1]|uniref:hypothetical protein n=1 Tax=Streptomyces sp. DH1 TaxID=2857012 RepID=UPI001E4B648F|nr:hypothetical protein [Streptomyces sp. DH1]
MAAMLLPPAALPRTQIIERTRHRYEDIHRLLEKCWTVSAIGRRLNPDRKTVRRFRDTDLDELLASARERRPNDVLDSFEAYLNARFTETQGQVSGTRLFRAIQARGYRGSQQVVCNTSPPSARAPPNRSGPTSRALARSPRGSCVLGRRSPRARTSDSFKPGSPARTSLGPAISLGRSPTLSAISADTCYRSGSGRPTRPHRSP